MESLLQVDHHTVDASPSSNGQPGIVVRALLTLSGRAPEHRARPPIGLAFVIDRSGSMAGDQLRAARGAVARAVERLHPDDVVSVVAFGDTVETVAVPDRRARHPQLGAVIERIEAGGCTNLSGGWLRAREHMQHAQGLIGSLPGSSRRVVLLTDGHANRGITDRSTLVELARTARSRGITTTTIGVGDGYDDALLRAMADAGGGSAWYIERPDQSQDVLGEELGNLLTVSAQGVSADLALGAAVSVIMVHSDWPASRPAEGILHFDLGDLYAAEPKPLLVELFVPFERLVRLQEDRAPIATFTVRADVVMAHGGVEHRTVHVPIASSLEGQRFLEPAVEYAVLLARTARAREEAAQRQREGDAHRAQQLMRDAGQLTLESPLYSDARYADSLQKSAQDLSMLAAKYRAGTHSELDAKYQMQRTYNARRGKLGYDETLRRKQGE